MPMTPKQMIKLLKKNGFYEVSQNGSHKKFR
ncbi:TPA: type II toxin-antitoxin system HicA family toxin, partial [Streptococcus pyogenes]